MVRVGRTNTVAQLGGKSLNRKRTPRRTSVRLAFPTPTRRTFSSPPLLTTLARIALAGSYLSLVNRPANLSRHSRLTWNRREKACSSRSKVGIAPHYLASTRRHRPSLSSPETGLTPTVRSYKSTQENRAGTANFNPKRASKGTDPWWGELATTTRRRSINIPTLPTMAANPRTPRSRLTFTSRAAKHHAHLFMRVTRRKFTHRTASPLAPTQTRSLARHLARTLTSMSRQRNPFPNRNRGSPEKKLLRHFTTVDNPPQRTAGKIQACPLKRIGLPPKRIGFPPKRPQRPTSRIARPH